MAISLILHTTERHVSGTTSTFRQPPGTSRHFCSMGAVGEQSCPAVVVLVAEDDVLIRMMAVDALTDAGFTVIEAIRADEALSILTRTGRDGPRLVHRYSDARRNDRVGVGSSRGRPMALDCAACRVGKLPPVSRRNAGRQPLSAQALQSGSCRAARSRTRRRGIVGPLRRFFASEPITALRL